MKCFKILLLLVVCAAANSSVHTFSSFDDGTIIGSTLFDTTVATESGLGLSVSRRDMAALFGGPIPDTDNHSNFPNVLFDKDDIAVFFWTDSISATTGNILRRNVRLTLTESFLENVNNKGFITPHEYSYLHVVGPIDNPLYSYVERIDDANRNNLQFVLKNNSEQTVVAANATDWRRLFGSVSILSSDTFLVVHSENYASLMLKKIYSRDNNLTVQDDTEVHANPEPNNHDSVIIQPSVAYNSLSENILVTWLRGNIAKNLHYRLFDRDLNPITGVNNPGLVVSDLNNNPHYYYDEVPVIAFAHDRFAIATWDNNGIYLHVINGLNGNIIETRQIASGQMQHTAIDANEEFVVVAYRNSADSSIEVIRIPIDATTLDFSETETFLLSQPAVPVTKRNSFSTALNIALSPEGSIAAVWRNDATVEGVVLARRAIREREGVWISSVVQLPVAPGDSVRFHTTDQSNYSFSTALDSWHVLDSVRAGGSAEEVASASWVSLNDDGALYQARGTNTHFQYKFTLNRNSGVATDSLNTPVLLDVTIPYNRKPMFLPQPDSVLVSGVRVAEVLYGDTITVLARMDSIGINFTLLDKDPDEELDVSVNFDGGVINVVNSGGPPQFFSSVTIPPFPDSEIIYEVVLEATDSYSWDADPVSLLFRTRNSAPILDFQAEIKIPGEPTDTSEIAQGMQIVVQQDDSLLVFIALSDTNDHTTAMGRVSFVRDESETIIDSNLAGQPLKAITLLPQQFPDPVWSTLRFFATDPDTVVEITADIRVNHIPEIISVTLQEQEAADGDTVRIVPGTETNLTVSSDDPDLVLGDTLSYFLRTSQGMVDSFATTDAQHTTSITPQRIDSFLVITVYDSYNRADSITIHYKYPLFLADTSYQNALITLNSGISLIYGSKDTAVVALPLKNDGNDSMSIRSLALVSQSGHWLSLRVPQSGDVHTFSSNNTDQFLPITIDADSLIHFHISLTADGLTGDGVVYDTLIIETSDPLIPFDSIPISLEHNDLPQILQVNVQFDPDSPYIPALPKRASSSHYTFPPHAHININFSEPIDSASARGGISLYSYYDFSQTGIIEDDNVTHSWNDDYTSVQISAQYSAPSPHFDLMPPPGIFIPTDSLILVLTSSVTDRANTPSGPNNLDVQRISRRDSGSDTTLHFSVDSIPFTVASVSPAPNSSGQENVPAIRVKFSIPVDPSTLDTSLANNQTLHVTSSLGGNGQITFDSISVSSTTMTAYPSKRLFYGDVVTCRLISSQIRDFLGFPPANTIDGIPGALFDADSDKDDVIWSFTIKNNSVVSVSPQEGATVEDVSPEITVTFEYPLFSGTFDTDTSTENLSIEVVSRYGGSEQSAFQDIRFSSDSTRVIITPTFNFFSYDSVLCRFKGFTTTFDYSSDLNLPQKGSTKEEYEWYFYTGETGFYTFPNPFRPSRNPRHCPSPAECGIWFKNLHTIDPDVVELRIRIFTMKALPVYDTKAAGVRVFFQPESAVHRPIWLWNTRNQAGAEVASGVYFYVIYDINDRALKRGKLMIVR